MGFNFRSGGRDQMFLLPPDMRDWLPDDHLVWFIAEVVEQLDLSAFEAAYRSDGRGRAAYHPATMVAVLLYAYCTGLRSSRVIERRCVEDVTFRVLAGGLCPDHVTIARFRARHEKALAGLFVQSLRLCAEAGLVRLGVVALDGTKMGANASLDANHTLDAVNGKIAAMLAEAAAVDAAEDHAAQQDPVDPPMSPTARRAAITAAADRLRAAKQQQLLDARKRLEAEAATRAGRLATRTEAANAARAEKGLPARALRPNPREKPRPQATTNLTDPDSRVMATRRGRIQGYNAQWAATPEQIIIAAQVTQAANDVEQLHPMLNLARATLAYAGIADPIKALVADAGYWRAANLDPPPPGLRLFIAVPKHGRRGKPRKDGKPSGAATTHLVEAMTDKLTTPTGRHMLRLRQTSIEPLFGQTKHCRGMRTFTRRGLVAAQAEWQLIAATSNLRKLHHATHQS